MYNKPFEISNTGEIVHKPEIGLEPIFDANLETSDNNIKSRLNSAVNRYRKYGSTLEERRASVKELADILEFLRDDARIHLDKDDEKDLFNIANNFMIRHMNKKQKYDYDQALWLSWIFYIYLATIHLLLHKISKTTSKVSEELISK